ncbi:hypothetical protein E4T43_02000 [Aureobasidium subglaciale]|nr:hypothetical protein E4T43_02000 [Aureobasidium subglaciale]
MADSDITQSNPAGISAPQFNPFEDTTNDGDPPINFVRLPLSSKAIGTTKIVLHTSLRSQALLRCLSRPSNLCRTSNLSNPSRLSSMCLRSSCTHSSLGVIRVSPLEAFTGMHKMLIDVKQGLNPTNNTRAVLNPSADPFLPARSQDRSDSIRLDEPHADGFQGPPSVRRVARTTDDAYSTIANLNAAQLYSDGSQRTSVNPSGNENYGGGFLLRGPASARRPARITHGFDSTNTNSNSRYSHPNGNPGLDGGQGTQMYAAIRKLSDHRNTMGYKDGNSYNDSTPAGSSFEFYRASGGRESGNFGDQERTMAPPAPRTPSDMPKISQTVASKKRRSSFKTKVPRIEEAEQGEEGEEDKQGSPERKPDRSGSGRKAANTKKRTEKEKADRKHARQRARGMRTQAHASLKQGLRDVKDQIQRYVDQNPDAEEDLGGLGEAMDQLHLNNVAQHGAADTKLEEVDDELEEKYQNRHKR